jgi:hypothetical protein
MYNQYIEPIKQPNPNQYKYWTFIAKHTFTYTYSSEQCEDLATPFFIYIYYILLLLTLNRV